MYIVVAYLPRQEISENRLGAIWGIFIRVYVGGAQGQGDSKRSVGKSGGGTEGERRKDRYRDFPKWRELWIEKNWQYCETFCTNTTKRRQLRMEREPRVNGMGSGKRYPSPLSTTFIDYQIYHHVITFSNPRLKTKVSESV